MFKKINISGLDKDKIDGKLIRWKHIIIPSSETIIKFELKIYRNDSEGMKSNNLLG